MKSVIVEKKKRKKEIKNLIKAALDETDDDCGETKRRCSFEKLDGERI